MLKLLKYELLSNYRNYCNIYLFYLIFCFVAPFLSHNLQDIFIPILGISSVAIMISVFVNIVISFCNSMFSKEGYLTHTLPYKTSVLLGSKFCSAILWLVITSVVLFGGIALMTGMLMMREGISLKEIYSAINAFDSFMHYELTVQGIHEVFSVKSMVLSGLIITLESLISTYMLIFMIAIIVNTPWIRSYRVPIGIVLFFVVVTVFDKLGSPIESIHLLKDAMYNVALINGFWAIIKSLIFYFIGVFIMDRYLEI